MWHALDSVVLLSNRMSITVRLLHVLPALVVHTTKHGYVNDVDPLHFMHLCL